jgi:pimeloyl-ACP methyl ester carboxylesterase
MTTFRRAAASNSGLAEVTHMRKILPLLAIAVVLTESVEAQTRRVEEASFVTIGGIEQWVTIRGDDDRKPVLLFLHGGPADVQSPFISIYAPYERDFVFVQWDQRGAGLTFAKNGAAGVTLERLIADGIDLAQQLRKRFAEQKLILFGHSWGSLIATGMAQQRADLFDAYVGTGQVTSWADTVQFQFDFLKRRYKEKGDAEALAALTAIGKPDPNNRKEYFSWSRPIRQFLNPSDTAWFADMRRVATANGATEATMKAINDGMIASGAALNFADLPTTAIAFKIPCYVIQGRDDLFAPTPLVEAFFNKVSAPKKRSFVIERAGHFAPATHQADVVAALKQVDLQIGERRGGVPESIEFDAHALH